MSEYERMRWRSRRGLLELDIVLSGFLEKHWKSLSPGQVRDYAALLEYPDAELWDIITGKREIRVGDGTLIQLIRMD